VHQIDLGSDIASLVDTRRTWRNIGDHTDSQFFTPAGQWIHKPTAPVSARRDGAEAMIVRTRSRSGRGRAHQVPSPTLPVKTRAVGGPAKAVHVRDTKPGSTSERKLSARAVD
jgi:hypothetical protein